MYDSTEGLSKDNLEINSLNYAELATRTEANDYSLCHQRLDPSSSVTSMRFVHAVMGLATEIGELAAPLEKTIFYGAELDRVNIKEELGDTMWYVGIAADELGFTIYQLTNKNFVRLRIPDSIDKGPVSVVLKDEVKVIYPLLNLIRELGEFTDPLKKFIFYGRPLDKDILKEKLEAIVSYATVLAEDLGVTLQELMTENIHKLSKRYPEKFTEDHALRRLDKQEDYLPKLSEGRHHILRYKDVVDHPMKWHIFVDDPNAPSYQTTPPDEFERWQLDRVLNVKAPDNIYDGTYDLMSATTLQKLRVHGIKVSNGNFRIRECLDTILELQKKYYSGQIPERHIWVEKLIWDHNEKAFKVSIGS